MSGHRADLWGSQGEFQRFCGQVTGMLGADAGFSTRVQAFLSTIRRLPLVWFQLDPGRGERAGDTFARCTDPWAGDMLFAQVPAAGRESGDPRALRSLSTALRTWSGRYVCVVEGSLQAAFAREGGVGRALQVAVEVCSNARAVLCVSTGAALAAAPALTSALGVPAIPVPGCPPTAVAFAATLVTHLLTTSPALEPVARALPSMNT